MIRLNSCEFGYNLKDAMLTRKLWPHIRRYVPVQFYPVLGTIHRWDEQMTIRRLERQDRHYLDRHEVHDVPPPRMRFRVFGECDVECYINGSLETRQCLEAALSRVGKSPQTVRAVLDFGCGRGRALRAFRDQRPSWKFVATDIDPHAVDWCREHLDFVDFGVNSEQPPLPFGDGQFDVIWTISVFTHLDEERQFQWLAELRRLLPPGGILLATVHGRSFWGGLPAKTARAIEQSGFMFARTNVDQGQLPDWYQVAWHTQQYVENQWSRFFDVLEYVPLGMNHYQDLVVLRRRDSA